MHYGDDKQIENNILKIVIYKHGGYDDENKYMLQLTSVQECKYFPIHLLQKILICPNEMLGNKIDKLKLEVFWLLTIKNTGYNEFEIISIEDTTNYTDYYHLH